MKKAAKKAVKVPLPTAKQWSQFNEVRDRFLQEPPKAKTAKKKRKRK
jgi:hypothetical protein